jgi:uncharacterized phage protein (TIGR01671 family)
MRDIKFRAWNYKRNRMETRFTPCCGESPINSELYYITSGQTDLELMQYTGMEDSKGTEIYEGDIVESPNSVFTVEWTKEGYWNAVKVSGVHLCSTQTVYGKGCLYEVIGNIYENPELLEGGEI